MSTAGPENVAAACADAWIPQIYRVAKMQRELADTVTLELAPPHGPCPRFAPGQFNMLYAFGVGEAAISISGEGGDSATFAHTVRDAGAVSAAIAKLDVGAEVGLRGPFGTGWPLAAAEGADLVFVAGGLGLAPLRPAILRVLAKRRRYGRVVVLVGSRRPADVLYRRELEDWRRRAGMEVGLTVDHADAGWNGHVGVVPELLAGAAFDPRETVAMVCGPEIMMRFTVAALRDAGVATDRIHLSMERNMKCAIGLCGHCQFGAAFICRDGPVMRFDRIAGIFGVHEV